MSKAEEDVLVAQMVIWFWVAVFLIASYGYVHVMT